MSCLIWRKERLFSTVVINWRCHSKSKSLTWVMLVGNTTTSPLKSKQDSTDLLKSSLDKPITNHPIFGRWLAWCTRCSPVICSSNLGKVQAGVKTTITWLKSRNYLGHSILISRYVAANQRSTSLKMGSWRGYLTCSSGLLIQSLS